ncbi:hypothetical protein ACOI1C_04850 [Bacillus sp. DJP31]|uniref:hypothetical protein n=1 Tax=Bacillus sp. DJP31 TaxID=3409789 RepID=UPI003BB6612F
MKKSEWSDKRLEELLQHLPTVKDRQDPDELFQKISSRMQNEQISDTKKKTWILPSIAAVAALLLFIIISPSFLNLSGGGGTYQESAFDTSSSDMKKDFASSAAEEERAGEFKDSAESQNTQESTEENSMFLMDMANTSNMVAVVGEGQTLVTIGIPDTDASNVVPLSIVSNDMTKTKIELLEDIIRNLNEGDLGLYSNKLEGLVFEEVDSKKVMITIPSNYTTGSTSAQIGSFTNSFIETFRWMGYTEVEFQTPEGEQVFIDPIGLFGPFQLSTQMKLGYYTYTTQNGKTYLVPSKEPSESFEEALLKMQERMTEYGLEPSVPIEIEYINYNGPSVTVTFAKKEAIDQNDPKYRLMIEAILLTAKEFGYTTVTFINTPEQIGGIVLIENGKPKLVDVPVAPNPIELPTNN